MPDSFASGIPCRRATAMYSDSRMIAVELIVIDVETRSSGMPSNSAAMSSMESIATPTRPTSPCGQRVVGVVAHLRGQVEGDAQAADALRQEIAIPGVGLRGRAEAGVLAHRPQPAAIHRRLDAAREGEFAGKVRARPWFLLSANCSPSRRAHGRKCLTVQNLTVHSATYRRFPYTRLRRPILAHRPGAGRFGLGSAPEPGPAA